MRTIGLVVFGVILFCLCSCKGSLPHVRGGQPDPTIAREQEERAKLFGVDNQIATLTYFLEKSKTSDRCVTCGQATDLFASVLKINGRRISEDIVGAVPVCSRDLCLKMWVEKFVGFKIDKTKKLP